VERHPALFNALRSQMDKAPTSRKKEVLNSNELARNKFHALFAADDAKNIRVNAKQQESASQESSN